MINIIWKTTIVIVICRFCGLPPQSPHDYTDQHLVNRES